MSVRAVRGATVVVADEPDLILDATQELVLAVLERNGLGAEDLISIVFTTTADLRSEFPAVAARRLGMTGVPLLCAAEIDKPGALPRVIRLMMHVETDRPRSAIRHVYLREARSLRDDLPR